LSRKVDESKPLPLAMTAREPAESVTPVGYEAISAAEAPDPELTVWLYESRSVNTTGDVAARPLLREPRVSAPVARRLVGLVESAAPYAAAVVSTFEEMSVHGSYSSVADWQLTLPPHAHMVGALVIQYTAAPLRDAMFSSM
jgi:hypothetical protein